MELRGAERAAGQVKKRSDAKKPPEGGFSVRRRSTQFEAAEAADEAASAAAEAAPAAEDAAASAEAAAGSEAVAAGAVAAGAVSAGGASFLPQAARVRAASMVASRRVFFMCFLKSLEWNDPTLKTRKA
jgi:hypothetical protein